MIICLFGTRDRPDADLDLERELLADRWLDGRRLDGDLESGF
jgi:hypothetical protein